MNTVLYCTLCPTVPVRVVNAYLWVQIVHAVVDHDIALDDIARAHWSDPISGGYRRIMLSAGVWLKVREEAFPVPAFHGPPEPTHLRYKERVVGWLRNDPFLQRVFEEAGRERPSADHHGRIIGPVEMATL